MERLPAPDIGAVMDAPADGKPASPVSPTARSTARLRRLGAAATLLVALLVAHVGPLHGASHVLVIHSYHSGLGWTDSIMAGIREVFDRSGREIEVSAEYLDARRYVDPERSGLVREAIKAKYRDARPDLVMVSDNDAFSFILAEGDGLFPGIPVVFVGVNHFASSMLSGHPRITGVAEEPSIVETVELALRLHPGVSEILVIGRTSIPSDKANRDSFVDAVARLPEGIRVTFWDDLPCRELERRLRQLTRGSLVFVNGLITDEKGRQLMYAETTKWIRSRTAAPLYSFWDVYFGHGIVGGRLVSGLEQGRLGAELALRILDGENAEAIPVIKASEANRHMFDYREIERFRIPLSSLPEDALFINRPDSLYRTHRELILTTAGVILVLCLFVVLLGITIMRRRKVEEALRQANLVVENSSAVLFRWKAAPGWPVELVSTNVAQFGYEPEELLSGKTVFASLIYGDDLERVEAEVERYSAGGVDHFEQEYRLVTRDGAVRWVYDRSAAERDARGAITHYQGIVFDVTERKEVEQKLKEKTEEIDRFFTLALDLLCIADTEGRFRRLNPQWEVVLGYSLGEMEGRNFFDFVHPDDVAATRQVLGDLEANKMVKGFVNRYRRKDGSYRSLEWRSHPAGNLIFAAARDISEARAAEEALRTSEEKYRDIFERAVEGIFQSTPDGRFLSVNPAFAQMLGYDSPEDLVGSIESVRDQAYVRPEERVAFMETLETSKSSIVGFEHELFTKDGRKIWISTNARAVRDHEGRVLYYEGTSENITERKHAEEEIRRLNEDLERRVAERTVQLEAANKELEAFSYSVSHDLRGPLRAIDGYARIVLEDYAPQLDDEGKRVCAVIEENARRMGRLIDDLLAFSRLSRSSMQLSPIDMGLLVDSVFPEVVPPGAGDRIDFTAGPLPAAEGDPALIRQVWVNLLSNAVKFSSHRERAVIEAGGREEEGEVVYFVRDNGAGFDIEYSHKLFGVFQRLHSEREFEGTGVGLAIVQRIIHRHGGRVWAEGKTDAGASFFFTLPRKGASRV